LTNDSKYGLEVFRTIKEFNKSAAEFIISKAKQAIAARGKFTIALSGGQTPLGLYSLLSEPFFSDQIIWEKTFVFWTDERCVPLDDERNNAHQAKLMLFDKINIPVTNMHIIPVNIPGAALQYESEIKNFFGQQPLRFDLILLGIGENGHTASLFPGTKVIQESAEGIREVYVEQEQMSRITMTAALINQARTVLFLVTGKKKMQVLKNILTASYQPDRYPAQLIKPEAGELFFFADKNAVPKPLFGRSASRRHS
jgi:6-phosphogluconolactonase